MRLRLLLLILVVVSRGLGQMIGALEDTPGHYSGEKPYRSVRALFQHRKGAWHAFPSSCEDSKCLSEIAKNFPEKSDWNIVFSGKQLGKLTTSRPSSYNFYSDVGQLNIADSVSVPTVGKRDARFAGFLETPVYRPLVAVSDNYFDDADRWTRSSLPPPILASVRKAFRNKFGNVDNCKATDSESAHPWTFSDAALKLQSAYVSKRHWYLAQISLAPYRCDGPPDEPFEPQWFVVDKSGKVQFVGSGMWLVDSGDYDNDGRSELLFAIDRHNRGGYRLFSDDFKQQATFEFSYH